MKTIEKLIKEKKILDLLSKYMILYPDFSFCDHLPEYLKQNHVKIRYVLINEQPDFISITISHSPKYARKLNYCVGSINIKKSFYNDGYFRMLKIKKLKLTK